MSEPIDLGRICMCLNAPDLDATAGFYEKLGFRRTGGAKGSAEENRILRQGVTILAFFDFLRYNMLNFRGASIHAVFTELSSRGFQCWEYNTGPELQLMVDDAENRCQTTSAAPLRLLIRMDSTSSSIRIHRSASRTRTASGCRTRW